MEHDFHAAVLLGFEGLVKIWTVGEIIAAVSDEQGCVDLLVLDELGQRFEMTALAAIDVEGNDDRSPFLNLVRAGPVSTTSPMNSCRRMSPLFIVGIGPSIR
jgi:hypothetical protein